MTCLDTAWQQHANELRAWLRHRLPVAADADDLMQDLFVKALAQGDQFCNIVNKRAWLFEVARNALADRFRIKREMVELPEDLVAEEVANEAVAQLSACLPRVLCELSAKDREAIDLCDLRGMSQADYAAYAGLNLSAAKSRLQRARQKMRQKMVLACQVTLDAQGHVEDFVPRPPLPARPSRAE
jgi:RNA polymerase sigma-70 factor (ECF subfamily)